MTTLESSQKSAGLTVKADMVAMTVLQLTETCIESLGKQLRETIANAPTYFAQAPVIIDLTKIPATIKDFVDLKAIHQLISDLQFIPVGVRGISDKQKALVKELGLAVLNTRVSESPAPEPKAEPIKATKPASKKAEPKQVTQTAMPASNKQPVTKVITKPVRSGMQVYAKGGDLMVLSTVNPGAEVIADGNIYVFGALRGRALAGASGNKQARIICQSLEAELIAIAGQYLTKETLGESQKTQGMLHVYLDDKKLMIEPT